MESDLESRVAAHAGFEHRDPTSPGTGFLRIVRSGSRSVVARAFATSPLRLLTPRNHGHAAWIYTATYGGGLVDGDAVHLGIEVDAGAAALLSTQASTKVYRSPSGTRANLDALVDDDAMLVVSPDPVVCFAGASYTQSQRFDLRGTAGLIVVDWLTSGRRGMGERWAFDQYLGRLAIRRDGRLLVHDALALRARDADVSARLQRFEVVCLIAILGPRLRAQAADLVQRVAPVAVARGASLLIGASALGEDGCIVRIAGVSVEAVAHAVRDHLRFVPAMLGDDPWARKW